MNSNELHKKFVEYGSNLKLWKRKCAFLLPEINRHMVWAKKGYSSIFEYAARIAGLSRDQVNEALRVFEKIKDKPDLMKVAEKKGLHAIKSVVNLATIKDQKFWAEKAEILTKPELEIYVRDFRNKMADQVNKDNNTDKKANKFFSDTLFADPRDIPAKPARYKTDGTAAPDKTLVNLKPETLARLAKHSKGDADALINKLLDMYEKELAENKPKSVQSGSRHIPKAIQNYVTLRSNDICEFPGCHRKREHFHHSNRFGTNKIHDPDQIFSLCAAHHNLVHRGLIDEKNWQIRRAPDAASLNNYIDDKVQHHRRK